MAQMKEFEIEIREELSRTVTVEAETLGDAIDQVMGVYKNGEIVLDAEDFVSVEFEVKEPDREINEEKANDRTERSDSRGR